MIESGSALLVTPGMQIVGSTHWYSGYTRNTVHGVIVRYFVGDTDYTWNRTNADSVTYQGYTVTISALDLPPDTGLVSQFGNPATVNWGPAIVPNPGGGGG